MKRTKTEVWVVTGTYRDAGDSFTELVAMVDHNPSAKTLKELQVNHVIEGMSREDLKEEMAEGRTREDVAWEVIEDFWEFDVENAPVMGK